MRSSIRLRAAGPLVVACGLLLVGSASATARADTMCLPGARCGSVTVPLDRQNPSAGTIDIRYALVPHTDAARPTAGTIVAKPRGPGQAANPSGGLYPPAPAPLPRGRDLPLLQPPRTRP